MDHEVADLLADDLQLSEFLRHARTEGCVVRLIVDTFKTAWRFTMFSDSRWVLELFSSKVSVDQDLSVIVAETINDDDVKQRLVPIIFTRA